MKRITDGLESEIIKDYTENKLALRKIAYKLNFTL